MGVEIEGTLQGDQLRDEMLAAARERFRAGQPVRFVRRHLELHIEEANDWADVVRYRIVLRQ